MKPVAPLLVLAALALAAPPLAHAQNNGRREHHGGWNGGGYGGPGGPPGGPGGPYGGPGGPGQGGPPQPGSWRGREAGGRPESVPYDGGPPGQGGGRWVREGPPPGYPPEPAPRQKSNSLGEGWREQQDEARAGVRSGALRPLGGVLSELKRRQPGRQLDAGIEQGPDGRPVYRVRWAAANGRRIDFIVDARTGAILAEEGR
jgi:hypothetical protein